MDLHIVAIILVQHTVCIFSSGDRDSMFLLNDFIVIPKVFGLIPVVICSIGDSRGHFELLLLLELCEPV